MDPCSRVPPSGEQIEIGWEDQTATIVEVGGGIRTCEVGGRAVLDPYPVEAMCDGAHGTPLIPWPNRLGDGRYHFDGAEHRVAWTEPEKANAIHGFLRWRPWVPVERSASRVVMSTTLHPMQGYPFRLQVAVAYELGSDGLTVAMTAANTGTRASPYGSGQHPYLSPGAGTIDDAALELQAGTRIVTDDERQLPTGSVPVEGTEYDFSSPRHIGVLAVDSAFTDLARDGSGRAWVRLTGSDGRTAELWVDGHHRFIELFSGDTLAPDRRRRGLGVEPMTCPPNALQSGDDVIRLEPGASMTASWGVRLR